MPQQTTTATTSSIPLSRLIEVESSGNPLAVSKKEARGLMQITEPLLQDYITHTSVEYTMDDMYSPYHNVVVGTWHLNRLTKIFNNDVAVVSSYNMGIRYGRSNIYNLSYVSAILGKDRVIQFTKGKKVRSWKGTWRVWYVED